MLNRPFTRMYDCCINTPKCVFVSPASSEREAFEVEDNFFEWSDRSTTTANDPQLPDVSKHGSSGSRGVPSSSQRLMTNVRSPQTKRQISTTGKRLRTSSRDLRHKRVIFYLIRYHYHHITYLMDLILS